MAQSRTRGAMISLALPAPHSHAWSIADQVLVSANNFLTGILLARVLGVQTFGSYVIAMMYLLYTNSLQSSLVVSPMMTAVPSQADVSNQTRLLRGFFAYFLVVLAISVVLVVGVAALLGAVSPSLDVRHLTLPLLAAVAAFQLQDWLRRVLYSKNANRAVFVADLLAYGGQFLGLVLLATDHALMAGGALWTLFFAFSISAAWILLVLRLTPDFRSGIGVMRSHWRTSRDFFFSWQLQWFGSQGIILLGTGMIGSQAAGAIRAAQNVLGPVTVVFQWMDNVVPVLAAQRFRERGQPGLSQFLIRIGIIGTCTILAFMAVVSVIDERLMLALYGEAYRGFGFLIVLQACYFLCGHIYRMLSYHSRTVGHTSWLASASAWWALAALASALVTVDTWHESGIMAALVIGELFAVAFLIWQYRGHLYIPTSRKASERPNRF